MPEMCHVPPQRNPQEKCSPPCPKRHRKEPATKASPLSLCASWISPPRGLRIKSNNLSHGPIFQWLPLPETKGKEDRASVPRPLDGSKPLSVEVSLGLLRESLDRRKVPDPGREKWLTKSPENTSINSSCGWWDQGYFYSHL